MKQNFEWFQDKKSINVKIYVGATSLKKIDVFLSDLVIKVNVKESNFLKIIDLHAEIDYLNNENLTLYERGILELYLLKKEPAVWPDLAVKSISKEDLIKRRDASLKRKEEYEKEFENQKSDLKIKLGRHSTQESMRIDQYERETIEGRKKEEKQRAEDDLYQSLDGEKRFTKSDQPPKQQSSTDIFNENEVPYIDEGEADGVNRQKKPSQNREGEVELKQEIKNEPIAEPRKATSVQMKFTEKLYPHLAARDSHYKDPPMPKQTSQYSAAEGSAEEKNPLLLKDKGDKFFLNGDYNSAINAYSAAHKIKEDLIECVANRSCCLLKLFLLEEALKDVNSVLGYIDSKKKDGEHFEKMKIKVLLRKGIIYSMKGLLDEGIDIFNSVLSQKEKLKEPEIAQIQQELTKITQRKEINNQKRQADALLKKSKLDEAITSYEGILRETQQSHEWILSNLALAYLKKEDYKQVMTYTDQVLQLTKNFTSKTTLMQSITKSALDLRELLMKTHFRRAKSYEGQNNIEKALEEAKESLTYDEGNAEAKRFQTHLQGIITQKEVETTKQEAAALIKEKKYHEALEKYNECLKKIPHTDVITYLSILLNKCTCHLFLEEFEDISSLSIRGLNLISNYRNRIIGFGDVTITKEMKEKLIDFEIRFLVRRGNAYSKLQKFYHAKSDFEEALKLDPKNEQLKKDLESINAALAKS